MATLKEIKTRIGTVQNTLKITSAMKVVSSAKLHQAQNASAAFSLYKEGIINLVDILVNDTTSNLISPYTTAHKSKQHATIVAFASDGSLCGAFNSNAISHFSKVYDRVKEEGYAEITVYPIGTKMMQAATKAGCNLCKDYRAIASKLNYEKSTEFARHLCEQYLSGKTDTIILIYSHFKSMGKQIPSEMTLLPMIEYENKAVEDKNRFIKEPQNLVLYQKLIEKQLYTQLHSVIIDNTMSEQASRSVAMHTATDEAEKLLDELTLTYNKLRQKSITDELSLLAQSEY